MISKRKKEWKLLYRIYILARLLYTPDFTSDEFPQHTRTLQEEKEKPYGGKNKAKYHRTYHAFIICEVLNQKVLARLRSLMLKLLRLLLLLQYWQFVQGVIIRLREHE